MAKSRAEVADPPEWFGVIKPSRLLGSTAGPGGQATNKDLQLQFDPIDMPESEDDDEDQTMTAGSPARARSSSCSRVRSSTTSRMSDYFRKMFGGKRSQGEGAAGAEMTVRSIRRVQEAGAECPAPAHADPVHR